MILPSLPTAFNNTDSMKTATTCHLKHYCMLNNAERFVELPEQLKCTSMQSSNAKVDLSKTFAAAAYLKMLLFPA